MAKQFQAMTEAHIGFIEDQHIYFVGTAAADGRVNISPKGMDSLRVVNAKEVVWLNLTGSGNETAAHILEKNRMTVMFCSFDRQPLILRLYGSTELIYPRHQEKWAAYNDLFGYQKGARQFYRMSIDMVQTSCFFAVPFYDYRGERDTLENWADKQGEEGIKQYWADRNQVSLDGLPTEILK